MCFILAGKSVEEEEEKTERGGEVTCKLHVGLIVIGLDFLYYEVLIQQLLAAKSYQQTRMVTSAVVFFFFVDSFSGDNFSFSFFFYDI